MTTTYELYTNENGTPKAVEGKAPAIIERVEALEGTLDNGVVTSVNGQTGDVTVDVGVTSFNGSKGAVTYSAPVSSVNGKTGAVKIDVGVTSVNGQTGAVTGLVRSVNGTVADPSGNVALQLGGTVTQKFTETASISKNATVTKTISGLTPYKPVFYVFKVTAQYYHLSIGVTSGGVLNSESSAFPSYSSDQNSLWSTTYAERGFYCIPTGTTMTLSIRNPYDEKSAYELRVFQ